MPMKHEYTYKALKVSPYNNSSHLTSVESKNVYKTLDYKNIIKPNTREKWMFIFNACIVVTFFLGGTKKRVTPVKFNYFFFLLVV